ncbi:HD domain-containing protein [Hathewaya massiliensis]|uniref:HD domain-containing protein n=1 Tax=Hathewaya massiliensis TaxID=1964382 RepID=UPI001FAA4E89|nr:HD domain-containing protein [Hathewaya massiliensis]
MEIKTSDLGTVNDEELKFAVIISRFNGKFLYVRHKERDTWEVPGGHRELNEDINYTAARELKEETGAVRFNIKPICDYSVKRENVDKNYGRLFYAEIQELGELHNLEIGEIALFEDIPENLTYPQIQPILINELEKRMKSAELIDIVSKIVEEQCKSKDNIFGYSGWTCHIVSVVKHAKILAKRMGADEEIVELAALLHDYASVKDKNMYEEHHIYGAIEAEKILKELDYPQEKIEVIKDCILCHRGSVRKKQKTKEAVCVASADAMAHIDQVPSLLHLVYHNRKMDVKEGAEWVSRKLERSWNKLCPEAKEIMKEKYESAKVVLKG